MIKSLKIIIILIGVCAWFFSFVQSYKMSSANISYYSIDKTSHEFDEDSLIGKNVQVYLKQKIKTLVIERVDGENGFFTSEGDLLSYDDIDSVSTGDQRFVLRTAYWNVHAGKMPQGIVFPGRKIDVIFKAPGPFWGVLEKFSADGIETEDGRFISYKDISHIEIRKPILKIIKEAVYSTPMVFFSLMIGSIVGVECKVRHWTCT